MPEATCSRCGKKFEGPDALTLADPRRHAWLKPPDGKRVYCATATPEELADYRVVVKQVADHRAKLKQIEEERQRQEGK